MCVYSTDNPQVGPSHLRVTDQKEQDVITLAVIYPVGSMHRAQSRKSLLKDRQPVSDRARPQGWELTVPPAKPSQAKGFGTKAGKAEMPGDKALSRLI